jgi:hypothetical protein
MYKSFVLEMTDYLARMTLEETQEEDNIEAADEDDDPSPPTPHAPRRDPVGRLSGDMKEHQTQAIVGVGKKTYAQKPCSVCAAHKEIKTPDIRVSATHAKSLCMEIASRGTTPG